MNTTLSSLIAVLPEVYQPIFGHPELSKTVSRQCDDRLAEIIRIYHLIEAQLGRPLRVLDLGCAQGFFSFSLAKLGATVDGVDLLDANITACQVLASEYPELKVSFIVGCIKKILVPIIAGQYDLVLGLSIFHHIVHEEGIVNVQKMLAELANKVAVGIFELALASEPPYWAVSQPHSARQLLAGFTFVHELAQHSTHLSTITRPLYVASNHYWCLNNQVGVFNTWQDLPHLLAVGIHQGTRRYFFGNGLIIKLFHLDSLNLRTLNTQELSNEVAFLQAPPAGYDSPQLLLHGQNKNEAWLVREQLPGELLIDIIHNGKPYDAKAILQQILYQLTVLETANLYHNDIRIWNVLVSSEGKADLIDYGAIANEAKDCVWPSNIFLAFLIFIYEVVTGVVSNPNPLRTIAISPYRVPQPYRKWLIAFWSHPIAEWSFGLMYHLFTQIDNMEENDLLVESSTLQHWMQAIECALDGQVLTIKDIQLKQQQIENREGERNLERKRIDQLDSELQVVKANREGERNLERKRIDQLDSELQVVKAKLDALKGSSEHWLNVAKRLNCELQHLYVYASKLWWVSGPLRQMMRMSRCMLTLIKRFVRWVLYLSKRII